MHIYVVSKYHDEQQTLHPNQRLAAPADSGLLDEQADMGLLLAALAGSTSFMGFPAHSIDVRSHMFRGSFSPG
jgi:hypothetical protein